MASGSAIILLIGCGKMGIALLSGWLNSDVLKSVYVVEPAGVSGLPADDRLILCRDAAELPESLVAEMAILAVKPQVMGAVAPRYAGIVERGATVLSIAAGQTLATLAGYFGPDAAIIRSMPNTPAAVSRGITVVTGNHLVQPAARELATSLLNAVGQVEWVDDETLLDAVTALSGGGPAYVFLLIDVLAAAGVKSGLPSELAMKLARTTVCGSGELAFRSPDTAEQLRRNVTSPNGTTLAALNVLMDGNTLQGLFDDAIAAATRRSKELAG